MDCLWKLSPTNNLENFNLLRECIFGSKLNVLKCILMLDKLDLQL